MSTTAANTVRPSALARITRAVARSTAPLSRPMAGRRLIPLWAVVHHRGRRSGRAYAVPVAIRVDGDMLTIPLPWGDETQWVRNVVAADGCTIRWNGLDLAATDPRVIGWEEASSAFHPIQQAMMRAAGVGSALRLRRVEG